MECTALNESQQQLVLEHAGMAKNIAMNMARKRNHAFTYEEALSAAYYGLILASTRHNASIAKFSTSGYYRASGQVLDDIRKKHHWLSGKRDKTRRPPRQFHEAAASEIGEAEQFESKESPDWVEQEDTAAKMMECLDDNERYVVQRVILDGQMQKTVAEEMGFSENKVFRIHKEAIQKMRANYVNDL